MSLWGSQSTSNKTKRSLFSSPFSAKKDDKRAKFGSNIDSETEDLVMEARGMIDGQRKGREKEAEPLADTLTIHEAISTRVNDALSALKPTTSGPESELLLKLIPALATAVSIAVGEVMVAVVTKMEERLKPVASVPDPALVSVVRQLAWENDRLQQYTRRESVRIFGVKQSNQETAEDVETKVVKVMKDAGVEVVPEDIAACHRAGKAKSGGVRPILVKFVSRRKRRELMLAKKTLRGKEGYDHVFVGDDLTPLRSRLLGMVKRLDAVEKAWVIDGRIHCQLRSIPGLQPDERPRPVVVETPDDLFRVGVTRVDYAELGLPHLAFRQE